MLCVCRFDKIQCTVCVYGTCLTPAHTHIYITFITKPDRASLTHIYTNNTTPKTKQDPVDEQTHGEALLRAMDTQVKLALQAQVSIAATVDALLSVLLLFRAPLAEIPLPPPSAVALEQALKDARRETILLNGRAFHVRTCVGS